MTKSLVFFGDASEKLSKITDFIIGSSNHTSYYDRFVTENFKFTVTVDSSLILKSDI